MPMPQPGHHSTQYSRSRGDRLRGTWVGACLLLVTVAIQSGCTVYQSARRTLIQEPSDFSWRVDRARSLKVYRQWADDAWAAESCSTAGGGEADDYALGFRDGFVDYVYAGGPGEPPPVPPRKFWNIGWRTPAGASAAQQWFAGYRHGSQIARDGGYRMGGIVNSAYAGTIPPAWNGPELESDAPPELIRTPNAAPPAANDYLDESGQMLPTPAVPTESLHSVDEPGIEELLDDPSPAAGVDDSRSEDVIEIPSTPPPADSESTTPTGGAKAEPKASDRFRRAVSSARESNSTGAQH